MPRFSFSCAHHLGIAPRSGGLTAGFETVALTSGGLWTWLIFRAGSCYHNVNPMRAGVPVGAPQVLPWKLSSWNWLLPQGNEVCTPASLSGRFSSCQTRLSYCSLAAFPLVYSSKERGAFWRRCSSEEASVCLNTVSLLLRLCSSRLNNLKSLAFYCSSDSDQFS